MPRQICRQWRHQGLFLAVGAVQEETVEEEASGGHELDHLEEVLPRVGEPQTDEADGKLPPEKEQMAESGLRKVGSPACLSWPQSRKEFH